MGKTFSRRKHKNSKQGNRGTLSDYEGGYDYYPAELDRDYKRQDSKKYHENYPDFDLHFYTGK
mgnify:CR=1 FL=1